MTPLLTKSFGHSVPSFPGLQPPGPQSSSPQAGSPTRLLPRPQPPSPGLPIRPQPPRTNVNSPVFYRILSPFWVRCPALVQVWKKDGPGSVMVSNTLSPARHILGLQNVYCRYRHGRRGAADCTTKKSS